MKWHLSPFDEKVWPHLQKDLLKGKVYLQYLWTTAVDGRLLKILPFLLYYLGVVVVIREVQIAVFMSYKGKLLKVFYVLNYPSIHWNVLSCGIMLSKLSPEWYHEIY